jgi:hypothetical protein
MHTQAIVIGTVKAVNKSTTKQGKDIVTVVIETAKNERGYADMVALETMKPEAIKLPAVGATVAAKYTGRSREYEGKVYSNLSLVEIETLGGAELTF